MILNKVFREGWPDRGVWHHEDTRSQTIPALQEITVHRRETCNQPNRKTRSQEVSGKAEAGSGVGLDLEGQAGLQ